jgi:hypothetical protein
MDFPEDAGGKTVADFHSNLSARQLELLGPLLPGIPWGKGRPRQRGTCEEMMGREAPRISLAPFLMPLQSSRLDFLLYFWPTVPFVLFTWSWKDFIAYQQLIICFLMKQNFNSVQVVVFGQQGVEMSISTGVDKEHQTGTCKQMLCRRWAHWTRCANTQQYRAEYKRRRVGQPAWLMLIIPATLEMEITTVAQGQPSRRLERLHLNQQIRCSYTGGINRRITVQDWPQAKCVSIWKNNSSTTRQN